MLVVWAVLAGSIALFAGGVLLLRADWSEAPGGWRLLAASGIPLALAGMGFIVRFWEPLPGPYRANELYPLGPHLNAWAVSFGFMWVAFGLTFYALSLRGPKTASTLTIMFAAWLLAWAPHGIIAVGFALSRDHEGSVEVYRDWASRWPGLIQLAVGAPLLLAHFALSLLGFGLASRSISREEVVRPGHPDPRH